MITVIGWIVFGFFIGLIARAIMPGRQKMGYITTTVLGVLGSLGGGVGLAVYNGQDIMAPGALEVAATTANGWAGLLASLVGAFVLLILGGILKGMMSKNDD